MADDVLSMLRAALPKTKLRLRATKYRGHAEQITYRTALLARHALVISVSGDGGYNEVVNGAMRAQRLGRTVTVGLVPGGNANDHYASRHHGDLIKRIVDGDEEKVDVIRLHAGRLTRYGHSYVGLGLTPQASEKLNAHKLNLWQEIKIVSSVLLRLKSVKILVDGEVRHYNSLIFSNVRRMSKIIRIPGYTSGDDGKMEVSYLHYRNPFKLVSDLIHAAVFGLTEDGQVAEFDFQTLRPTSVQIDGEVVRLAAGVSVHLNVVGRAIRCIV